MVSAHAVSISEVNRDRSRRDHGRLEVGSSELGVMVPALSERELGVSMLGGLCWNVGYHERCVHRVFHKKDIIVTLIWEPDEITGYKGFLSPFIHMSPFSRRRRLRRGEDLAIIPTYKHMQRAEKDFPV